MHAVEAKYVSSCLLLSIHFACFLGLTLFHSGFKNLTQCAPP